MKRKFKRRSFTIPPISTKTTTSNYKSLHNKYQNIWRWKSRSWLRTGTEMWRFR